jgi:ArsR family transcriptional regulator
MIDITNQKMVAEKAELIKALANPIRLCMVKNLIANHGANVNTIQECLGASQSSVSQHLAKLKSLKIVEARREGKEVFYYVTNQEVCRIVEVLFDEE